MRQTLLILFIALFGFTLQAQTPNYYNPFKKSFWQNDDNFFKDANGYFQAGIGGTAVRDWNSEINSYDLQYFVSPSLSASSTFPDGHEMIIRGQGFINKNRSYFDFSGVIYLNAVPVIQNKDAQIGMQAGVGVRYSTWTQSSGVLFNVKLKVRHRNHIVFGRVSVDMVEARLFGTVPEFTIGYDYRLKFD